MTGLWARDDVYAVDMMAVNVDEVCGCCEVLATRLMREVMVYIIDVRGAGDGGDFDVSLEE